MIMIGALLVFFELLISAMPSVCGTFHYLAYNLECRTYGSTILGALRNN